MRILFSTLCLTLLAAPLEAQVLKAPAAQQNNPPVAAAKQKDAAPENPTPQAQAMPETPAYGIIAVVGEQPISNLDVVERMQLLIATANLSDTAITRQNLMPQVLKQLVDEELQKQAATTRNIKITDGEISDAVVAIESQNGRPQGALRAFLKSRGVPWRAFLGQVRGQLTWQKLLAQAIRPAVKISDSELQRAAQNRRFSASNEEVNITPLILGVDTPEMEEKIKTLAEKLVAEVRGGATFEEVARQFTKSDAGSGEAPNFWVPLNQMEPALAEAIRNVPGVGLLDPVRTKRGYQIIRINERRRIGGLTMEDPTQVVLKEVKLGLPKDATPKQVDLTLQLASEVALNPGTCLDQGVAGIKDFADTDIEVGFIRSTISALPDYVQRQAESLNVGEVGVPFATPDGIRFYILCEKVEMPATVKADDKLRDILFREKLELESQKFMRNLRRDIFVEIR